jgi:peptide/nickel transport system permease protein
MMSIGKKIVIQLIKIIGILFIICGIEYLFLLISPGMSEQVDAIVQKNSILEFYIKWFFNAIFRFDFGRTLTDGRLISEVLSYSSIITLKLTIGALGITIIISLTGGVLNVMFPNAFGVKVFNQIVAFLSGFHVVVLGAVAIRIFGLFGSSGVSLTPLLILTFGNGALQDAVQYIVQAIKKIFNSDYIRATKARGGNVWLNALKEIAISILTLINSRFPYLIGGAFIVEYFFSINGLGMQIIDGVKGKESLFLMSITLIVALVVLLLNSFIQEIHITLDPRLRKEN